METSSTLANGSSAKTSVNGHIPSSPPSSTSAEVPSRFPSTVFSKVPQRLRRTLADVAAALRRRLTAVTICGVTWKWPSKYVGAFPPVPTRQELQSIVVSMIPYLLFLLFYAVNPYLHVLPLAIDINCGSLRNISVWESYVLPLPIGLHVIVASLNFLLLDFLAAVPYLAHYFIPILYPAYLYSIDRLELVRQFYLLIGMTMWGHYVIWYFLPTLPPWAVDFIAVGQGGNATTLARDILAAHKEGPAFARIDRFIERPFFYRMFVGNPVPFGSFPSGHVAWVLCIFLTLPAAVRPRFGAYVVWMAWATLYTGHHYVLDILGAVVLVILISRSVVYVVHVKSCQVLPL